MVKPRTVRCKLPGHGAMGRTGYWCYGMLEPAPIVRAKVETGKLETKLRDLQQDLDKQLKDLQRVARKIEKTRKGILATERAIIKRDSETPVEQALIARPNPNPETGSGRAIRRRSRHIELPPEQEGEVSA